MFNYALNNCHSGTNSELLVPRLVGTASALGRAASVGTIAGAIVAAAASNALTVF